MNGSTVRDRALAEMRTAVNQVQWNEQIVKNQIEYNTLLKEVRDALGRIHANVGYPIVESMTISEPSISLMLTEIRCEIRMISRRPAWPIRAWRRILRKNP